MSEYRQMIERLRALYLSLEAENTTLLSQQYAPSKVTPSLSTKTTEEEKQLCYYQGFLAGVRFFQACIQDCPKHLPSFTRKEGSKA